MLSFPARVRIFAAVEPTDFRKGFDRLVQIVRDVFEDDPFAGDLFCFFNWPFAGFMRQPSRT